MSLFTNLGIGFLGVSALVGPGIWVLVTSEPRATTVAESGASSYTGKFGDDFKHHLVSDSNDDNNKWWNWSFKYRWQSDSEKDRDGSFKNIKDGLELKSKCKEAYDKVTKTDINTYEKAVWRYCSLEGQKPVTVKETSVENKNEEGASEKDTDKIGKVSETKLISTLAVENSRFWEIQEKAFFKEGDKEGLGSSAESSGIFKDLYDKGRTSTTSLRLKCQEAYKKTASTSSQDKKNAFLFCSLNPKGEEGN